MGPQRRQKAQMRHAEVLRFVHHGKVERCVLAVRQHGEHGRVRDQLLGRQCRAHPLKNGPQHRPLWFWQPCLAPQAGDVTVVLSACKLPGSDDLLPLRQQKVQAEFVTTYGLWRMLQHLPHRSATGQRDRSMLRLVETQADGVE